MSKEKAYSQSEIKAYRRCPKSHDYKYSQMLSRRTAPSALLRGTVLHSMLELHILGKDWREPLVEYRKTYNGLWAEERETYPSPEELEGIVLRYLKHWENDGLDYGGRTEVEIRAEHRGILFKGIIDALPDDSMGRRWLGDHKTHKVLPDEATRFSDIQTVLYYWAVRENGEAVDGILWDYIRTKPPAIPETLKSGGLSKRKNIDTDTTTYLAEIHKQGLDPKDYQDILAIVEKNNDSFFKRIYLPRPNEKLIQSVVKDFFDTAEEIRDNRKQTRNMTRDCKSCTFYQLCSAEVRGLDSEFIRKQLFVVKDS